ncbi:hypothetical protein [Clostridium sp.]|uniref:hypothetical protein n=1 Tax=Clostridium sp. TaxID=1506 RepID=UPI002617C445|nr:hypothetical protein [Clostridium sp.]
MIGTDVNEKTINNNTEKSKRFKKLYEIGNTLHRYSLWMIVAALIGISVGVKASQIYFYTKMSEATVVGGMVFKEKVYQVIPK